MRQLQLVLISIGTLILTAGAASAQSAIHFASNNYFTFGDPDGRTAGLALADFDDDGDVDIFTANGRHWAQQDYIYLNNGAGRMLTAIRVGETLSTAYKPVIADIDDDGDMDIVSLRDRVESRLFINRGNMNFDDKGKIGISGPARSASIADIDNNGRLDVLIAQRSGRNYVIYDVGHRRERVEYIDQETQSVRGAIADFNQDGFPDAVFANIGAAGSYVVMNNGEGTLDNVIWLGENTSGAVDVAVADLDNDGDDDIILSSWDPARASSIVTNEGNGRFAQAVPFALKEERTFSLEAGDLNNDGLVDIVMGNVGQPNAVYLAKEDLTYERIVLPHDEDALTYDVAIGDLNGDGTPDLIFANSDSRNRIHLNVSPDNAEAVLRR